MSSPSSDSANKAVPLSEAAGGNLSGRRIGDYLLLCSVGSGAMAEVYLATQTSLDRHVAVKILKPSLAADKAYVQRFAVEAKAAAGLSHANIVQIHEVGMADGLHYIVQELVRGKNLAQILVRSGPLPHPFVIRVLAQVASALQRSSEQRIVHRDIKPENVMITLSGEVKVTDFGLARHLERGSELTQVGVAMGTPLYMSPEQVEGVELDVRSDLYALGATAYHLLAGVPPFLGESAISVAIKHLKEQPPPLSDLRPELPQQVCEIIHKLLAKKPGDRFQSPRDLLKALKALPFEWADEDESWSAWRATLSEGAPGGSLEATWRLQTMMTQALERKTQAPKRRLISRLAIVALLGGLIAGFLSDPRGPRRFFGVITAQNQGDVWKTLYHARITGSPAAWESVLKFYPNDPFARSLALRELGENYLRQKSYSQAIGYYQQLLGAVGGTNNDRAVALAGIALSLHGLNGPQDRNRSRDFRGGLTQADMELLMEDAPWLYEQLLAMPVVDGGESRST